MSVNKIYCINYNLFLCRIGFAIAKRLGLEGAKVVVSSRKSVNVENAVSTLLKDGLDVHGVVCHVSKAEDRKNLYDKAVEKYGGIDILVSNAAVNPAVGHVLQVRNNSACIKSLITVINFYDNIFSVMNNPGIKYLMLM